MLKKQPNHGFFDNWGGITTKNPQHTPRLPSSCSLSKFLEMNHKPQINGALMEVLTLPKAGVALQQPYIPLLTPSLLPSAGIMQVLRELTHGESGVGSSWVFSPSFLLRACREGIWQEDLAAWQLVGKQKEQLSVQNGAASVAGGHPAPLAPASDTQHWVCGGAEEEKLSQPPSKGCSYLPLGMPLFDGFLGGVWVK